MLFEIPIDSGFMDIQHACCFRYIPLGSAKSLLQDVFRERYRFLFNDLRFPELFRQYAKDRAELMIVIANWPVTRIHHWSALLKARAIENQCYVAGVNRIGIDGTGIKYCGDSTIFDPYGRIIASGNKNETNLITGEISVSELHEFRKKFPVLDDSDNFKIEL